MNIKQNLGILAQRISRSRNATRTFMMGLNPMPEKVNESSLIQNSEITSLHRWIYMRYKHTDKGKGNVGAFPEVVEEILFLA